MKRCWVVSMPHNYRSAFYGTPPTYFEDDDGVEVADIGPCPVGPFLTLPIPMPESVTVFTGRDDEVLAIHVRGDENGWIRREDVETVWCGIQQYNADLKARGETR